MVASAALRAVARRRLNIDDLRAVSRVPVATGGRDESACRATRHDNPMRTSALFDNGVDRCLRKDDRQIANIRRYVRTHAKMRRKTVAERRYIRSAVAHAVWYIASFAG